MIKKIHEEVSLNGFNYVIIGCSVIGQDKDENQDSWFVNHNDTSIVLCLADGLGSAIYSKQGADNATKIMAESLLQTDYINLSSNFKSIWKNTISSDLNLYDTTIRFIKVEESQILYGGIGDGWIGIKCDNMYYHDTYAHFFSNQTDSILSLGYYDKFKMIIKPIKEFQIGLLTTDGFSEDIDDSLYDSFIDHLYHIATRNTLELLSVIEDAIVNWPVKTNTDDKTILMIVKKEV